jgi:pimeloyl-ACP methyl ester carboxylesterase
MSISRDLGETREAELPQGTLVYRERGGGEPLLFLHGLWVTGDHWRKVVPLLAERHRCITPDLPLGAHSLPMGREADLSPHGVARLIADFLERLDLDGVTVVANDTADAIAQILITEHPARVAAVVLTPGDAFTNFLPYVLKPMRALAFVPGAMFPAALFWNSRFGQRVLWWFLAQRPPSREVSASYFRPAAKDAAIRRDLAKFVRRAGPSVTLRAARRLRGFEKPALVVWTRARRIVFPYSHGRRLAALLPQSRFVEVTDSYAFIPEDQPERLAELVSSFVEQARPTLTSEATRVGVTQ